jgi:hypothetical protein
VQESKEGNGETPSLFKENYPPPRTYYSLIGCSPSAQLSSRERQNTWWENCPCMCADYVYHLEHSCQCHLIMANVRAAPHRVSPITGNLWAHNLSHNMRLFFFFYYCVLKFWHQQLLAEENAGVYLSRCSLTTCRQPIKGLLLAVGTSPIPGPGIMGTDRMVQLWYRLGIHHRQAWRPL